VHVSETVTVGAARSAYVNRDRRIEQRVCFTGCGKIAYRSTNIAQMAPVVIIQVHSECIQEVRSVSRIPEGKACLPVLVLMNPCGVHRKDMLSRFIAVHLHMLLHMFRFNSPHVLILSVKGDVCKAVCRPTPIAGGEDISLHAVSAYGKEVVFPPLFQCQAPVRRCTVHYLLSRGARTQWFGNAVPGCAVDSPFQINQIVPEDIGADAAYLLV